MLSQTSKIAIKAIIYLSDISFDGKKAGVNEVAEKINASKHTVSKALQTLVRRHVINSQKGPAGGFYLSEEQQSQAIYKIIEAIDGGTLFTEYGLGLKLCSETRPCPIHNEYKVVRERLESIFKEKKVQDLRETVSDGLAFLMD